jgi:oxygen-dependent protoporphyrinogen oxidase
MLALEKSPSVYLAGVAYRGVGIPDCIRQGTEAARKALAFLSAPQ